jgi:Asp-tRNA(Asn)/Glu-tRNA(Gln) amidotransferase A subunit family amidase
VVSGEARAVRRSEATVDAPQQASSAVTDELFYRPAVELAGLVRRRELSPVELVDRLFERIARLDPAIGAYATLAHDQARRDAHQAERLVLRGDALGPLHGVPISVKDNLETAGLRTTYGSRLFAEHVPIEDAVSVERLKAAGAIVVGKTNLPELASKSITDSPLFGDTRNPWAPDRVAGGSSGGAAAAVAAGLGPLALGTDASGSIRIPAACCGVLGLKPTAGRVPQHPNQNPWEIASQVGPLARVTADLDLALRLIGGPDPRDPISLPPIPESWDLPLDSLVRPWRFAWSSTLGFARVEPEVLTITGRLAKHLAVVGSVNDVALDLSAACEAQPTLSAARRVVDLATMVDVDRDEIDARLADVLRTGRALPAARLAEATTHRARAYAAVEALFREYDFLVTPTLAAPPFAVGLAMPPLIAGVAPTASSEWHPFTFPFNLTGHPAIAIPAGWTEDGLPVGLQVVGRRFADRELLAVARHVERSQPWADRRPPLDARSRHAPAAAGSPSRRGRP